MSTATPQTVPSLIGGQWLELDADAFEDVYNPSTGGVIGRTPLGGPADVLLFGDGDEVPEVTQLHAWKIAPINSQIPPGFRMSRQLVLDRTRCGIGQ